MSKKVRLSFTVTGAFDDLEVFVNDERIKVTGGKGKFSDDVDDKVLKADFEISGNNGTEYTIKYECTSDDSEAKDPNKPSPVEGKIIRGGFKREKLSLKL
jgi:hypothetical protein